QQLFSIEGKPVLYEEFGNFILRSQRKPTPKKDYKVLVNELYTQFLNAKLLAYQEQNLENDNEEFAQIVNEYRDGLLLFDLMKQQICNAGSTDTPQTKTFYQNHVAGFFRHERIDATQARYKEPSSKKPVVHTLTYG